MSATESLQFLLLKFLRNLVGYAMFALPFKNTSWGSEDFKCLFRDFSIFFQDKVLEKRKEIRSLRSHLGTGSRYFPKSLEKKFFEVM